MKYDLDEADARTRLMQMISGYWVTQIVRAAAQLRYADLLATQALTANERRHLQACASVGLVSHHAGHFASTPLLDLLRADHPRSLAGFARSQAAAGHWLPWGRFDEALRTGEPQAQSALGASIFDYMAEAPGEAEAFGQAMKELSAPLLAELPTLLDRDGCARAVDVGGAGGSVLPALVGSHGDMTGVLYDRSVEGGRRLLGQLPATTARRIELVAGDFFREVPSGDLMILKQVLHNWDDERCLDILSNCRRAISARGRIAVIELVLGAPGPHDFASLMDMNMLVMVGGRERTLEEFTALLERAGFGDVRLARTSTPMSIIQAEPI
jgi:hypothetical protein